MILLATYYLLFVAKNVMMDVTHGSISIVLRTPSAWKVVISGSTGEYIVRECTQWTNGSGSGASNIH